MAGSRGGEKKKDSHSLHAYPVLGELTHFLPWKIKQSFFLTNEGNETTMKWFVQGSPTSLSG